jgi:glutamine amidotransferase
MGWNQVYQAKPHALWQDIADGERFYYVHSYYVQPEDDSLTSGYSAYPSPFTSAIAINNLFAVQFHPEKSANAGLQMLSNFVRWQP